MVSENTLARQSQSKLAKLGMESLLPDSSNVNGFEFILVPVFCPERLEGALELFGHSEAVLGAHFDELRVLLAEVEP